MFSKTAISVLFYEVKQRQLSNKSIQARSSGQRQPLSQRIELYDDTKTDA